MALPAVLLGIQISGWIFFITPIRDGHPDFRANYTAGLMVRSGRAHELYDYEAIKAVQDRFISREVVGMPFIHPAYEALAYVPFSLLPFHVAYCAFLITNLLLLFLCYRMLRPELESLSAVWKPLPIAVCLTFLPAAAALMQGQDSILLLTLFTWAWLLMTGRHDFAGGLVLGLGLFRFQFLAPIVLLFLLWRRWRIVFGSMLSAGLLSLTSVVMVGLDGVRSYLRLLASMSIGGVSELERVRYYQPVKAMGSLRALVSTVLSPWLSDRTVQIIVIALSLAIIVWVLRAPRPDTSGSVLLLLAVTTSAIVGYHMFIHDMAILLLPVGVWLGRSISSAEPEASPLRTVLLGSTVMFGAPMLMVFFRSIHFCWITLAVIGFLAVQIRIQTAAAPNHHVLTRRLETNET